MPNKFNAKRRHHILKMKFKVRNWAAYDAGLKLRGSLTLWVTPDAMPGWQAGSRPTPGGQPCYSGLAIEMGLMGCAALSGVSTIQLSFDLPK